MKPISFLNLNKLMISILFGCLFCGLFFGCKALRSLDQRMADAVISFDRAIASLNQQSNNWQTVITQLQEEISADMQSTISTEVENLTRNVVLTAGAEVRCNSEFIRIKLRDELIIFRNSIAQAINKKLTDAGYANQLINIYDTHATEPFICDIVPSAVDLSIEKVRRQKLDIYGFNLRAMPIYVSYRSYGQFIAKPTVGYSEFLAEMTPRAGQPKTLIQFEDKLAKVEDIKMNNFTIAKPNFIFYPNITSALTVLSDFHAVLDLTVRGADLPPTADVIIFSWNNKLQAEIPILTHIQTLVCKEQTVSINSSLDQTHQPPHYGTGDKKWWNHGPCMKLDSRLELDSERKNLYAILTLDAWECNSNHSFVSDYTAAFGTKRIPLFSAGDNQVIVSYDAKPSYSHPTYRVIDDEPVTQRVAGTEMITDIKWYGRTGKRKEDAGQYTRADVKFRQFHVTVQTCVFK